MKKTFITALAAILCVAALNAQNYDGDVRITDIKTATVGDSLRLEMKLAITDSATTKNNSLSITPILSDGKNEKKLPYVLVNGRLKNQLYQRKLAFAKDTAFMNNLPKQMVVLDRNFQSVTLAYSETFKHEPWMDNGMLNIRWSFSSYAGENQFYTTPAGPITPPKPIAPPPPPPAPKPAPKPAPQPVVVVVEKPAPEPPKPVVHTVVVTQGRHTFSGDAYLDFESGRSALLPNYKRNPDELEKIGDVMNEIRNNPKVKVNSIEIVGNASPDGGFNSNDQLALARAQSLADYLTSIYGVERGSLRVRSNAEDWKGLRDMVVESNMQYKEQTLSMIDSDLAPDTKEARLKGLAGGRNWRTMSSTMFPRLRRVTYNIDYEVSD
jgi:outer membrane protein OmpA-like peptidoglycan-associated protein